MVVRISFLIALETHSTNISVFEVFVHRRNPTAVRRRCVQRCDSENEHNAVTAMVRIVMLQRWDISGFDTDVTAMFTLV